MGLKPIDMNELDTVVDNMGEPEPLLAPWLLEESYVLLQAATKHGKTWAALGIAMAVAGGGTFLGGTSERPRPVLYIDAENGPRTIQRRRDKLAQAMEGLDDSAMRCNLHGLFSRHHDDDSGRNPFPLVDGASGSDTYVEQARRIGAALVVIDTKAKLVKTSDESQGAEDAALSTTVERLKRLGCAVLVLHHLAQGKSPWEPTASRGTSALPGSVNVVLGLQKRKDSEEDAQASFRMAVAGDAARDGEQVDVSAELKPNPFGGYLLETINNLANRIPGTQNPKAARQDAELWAAVRAGSYANQSEFERRTPFSRKKLNAACRRAGVDHGRRDSLLQQEAKAAA